MEKYETDLSCVSSTEVIWSKNAPRPKLLHIASKSKIKKMLRCLTVIINKNNIAYVARKVIPPTRPLSSTVVRRGTKAKHEGKPIPNAKPKKATDIATSYLPSTGRNMGNNEEIIPKRIQKERKRVLSNLSAITGPSNIDINTTK